MRRTLEDSFNLIQNLHISMCYNPKYSKLPFSKRDKIIAKWMNMTRFHVQCARGGYGYFKRFENKCDAYIKNSSELTIRQLFQIVQCYYVNLRSDEKYKDCSVNELDIIIAKSLGYTSWHITNARTGTGSFKILRGCVQKECVALHPKKETCTKVRNLYRNLIILKNGKFANMKKMQRYEFIAKIFGLKSSTVSCIIVGAGNYARYGSLYHPEEPQQRGTADRVREEYLRQMQNEKFAKLKIGERDAKIAEIFNLSKGTVTQMRIGGGMYSNYKNLEELLKND